MGLADLRVKAAMALLPSSRRRFVSDRTPNIPIYSDMTVSRATRQGYKVSVYVYRSVRTIIQACSAIPWLVVDKDNEEIPNHPFTLLMQHPNPEFSGQDMIEFLVAHLELCGNALWQPVMVNGLPREIWPVMPDIVSPIPSDVQGEWLKSWEVRTQDGQFHVPPETFVHFMQVDPGNPYWGIGPLMAAAKTIDTDNEAQDTQKVSMQNRGTPSGIFSHDAPQTEEQFEEANRRVQEIYLSKSRRRAPWVLGAGVKWQQMAMTPVEMDYVASRLRGLRDIAGAFGISPIFLGDMQQSTLDNMRQSRLGLYEDVVIPLLDDIKATLNLKLAPYYGDITITYDTSNVSALREGFGAKVESAYRLWSMGVPMQQVSDKLQLGLSEYPGWDASYLPLTLQSTKSAPTYRVKADVSEQQKAALWTQMDRRRVAWWPVIAKRMQLLYDAERDAVLSGALSDATAQAAVQSLAPQWEKTVQGTFYTLLEDFGKDAAQSLGATKSYKWEFNPMNVTLAEWVKEMAASEVVTILATNLSDVRRVLESGLAQNLSNDEIARNLRQFYADGSPYKAMRVARTETTKGATHATIEAARQSGLCDMKQWITARDDRVRDEHAAMDGETVPLDGMFSNGMEGPGEPNCRCGIVTPVR